MTPLGRLAQLDQAKEEQKRVSRPEVNNKVIDQCQNKNKNRLFLPSLRPSEVPLAIAMSVIQSCFDTKDTLDLFRPQGLYLKPVSRLNVSVQLPQLKKSGAKISNWEVMERVKDMAKPFTFPVFKVR